MRDSLPVGEAATREDEGACEAWGEGERRQAAGPGALGSTGDENGVSERRHRPERGAGREGAREPKQGADGEEQRCDDGRRDAPSAEAAKGRQNGDGSGENDRGAEELLSKPTETGEWLDAVAMNEGPPSVRECLCRCHGAEHRVRAFGGRSPAPSHRQLLLARRRTSPSALPNENAVNTGCGRNATALRWRTRAPRVLLTA